MSTHLGEPIKCAKCSIRTSDLLCSFDYISFIGRCYHIYFSSCFKKENDFDFTSKLPRCPCCQKLFYEYVESMEEALLIGEAAYLLNDSKYISPELGRDESVIHKLYNEALSKYEQALLINPSNIIVKYCIVQCCVKGLEYCREVQDSFVTPAQYGIPRIQIMLKINSAEHYHCCELLYNLSYELIEQAFDEQGKSRIHILWDTKGYPKENRLEEWYNALSNVLLDNSNITAALQYAKLAYETCLRSPSQPNLDKYKENLMFLKNLFAEEEAPLRFAVGDIVEFLHEKDGSEWKLGKIVELYYRERSFPMVFTAPYRLQLLGDSGEVTDPPVYAYVRADFDRYIRKPGVKLVEDTRYQARLDAKVAELANVYCTKEFVHDIYHTLAQDCKFVEMLANTWHIALSERVLHLYRMLVMYREPLLRTDSGYHLPTADEVIAGIRAYFSRADKTLASPSAAANEQIDDDRRIKAVIVAMLQHADLSVPQMSYIFCIENRAAMYMRAITGYPILDITGDERCEDRVAYFENGFSVPLPSGCLIPEISAALATVAGTRRLESMIPVPTYAPGRRFLIMWKQIVKFLDKSEFGLACECPFVYFFVKFCLDQGMGVPKPALVVYDRMNMQLSREFIRCANTSCEHNKLDKSTGKVKFKQCSRCRAVIYCSRDCQTAHYPEHKRLCREHLTG